MARAARAARDRGPHRQRAWLRAHLRRRPPRAGHPGRARDPRARSACRRPSSWSASRCCATPRWRARSLTPATGSALHCHRHRNLLRLTPPQVRDDIARAHETTIAEHTGCAPRALSAAVRRRSTRLRCASLARSGWRTLLWSHWGRDWEARATAASITARVTDGAGAGSVLLLHDADDYSAPSSWRRTAAALPRVIDTLAQRGLQPVVP